MWLKIKFEKRYKQTNLYFVKGFTFTCTIYRAINSAIDFHRSETPNLLLFFSILILNVTLELMSNIDWSNGF